MTEKHKLMPITEGRATEALGYFKTDPAHYMREVLREMTIQQPQVVDMLNYANSLRNDHMEEFEQGGAVGFDVLQDNLKKVEMTRDEARRILTPIAGDFPKTDSGMLTILDFPDLKRALMSATLNLTKQRGASFLLGMTTIIAPFYARAEETQLQLNLRSN